MPELSEVELTRRDLLPRLRGRRILDFWTDWPQGLVARGPVALSRVEGLRSDMRGRTILDVTRRGKVLFFKLSPRRGSGQVGKPERIMAIHLRMSGKLEVTQAAKDTKAANAPKERRWTHFTWLLSPRRGYPRPAIRRGSGPEWYRRELGSKAGQAGGRELRFVDPRKFGVVWYGAPDELRANPYLGALGEDPHRLAFPEFHGLLRSGRGRVKPFLLRQDRFAGIGNIIADEALWRARIHSCAPIAGLSTAQARRLHRAIAITIGAMLDAGGTTLRNWGRPDGRAGRYQEERLVYGKAGKPCPRCGMKLLKIVVGGRGTTVCPACQKAERFES